MVVFSRPAAPGPPTRLLLQLPVLRDLQRVLEEMSFGLWDAQPGGHASHAVIVEQVPSMRSAILRGVDWPALAERQRAAQFGGGAAALSAQRLGRMLRGIDLLAELEEEGPPPQVGAGITGDALWLASWSVPCWEHWAASQIPLVGRSDGVHCVCRRTQEDGSRVKVDAYRRVKGEAWEWWASYTLDLDPGKPAEAVAVPTTAAAADDENTPQRGAAGEQPAGPLVKGRRHRLLPLGCDSGARALPGDAKLSVLYCGRSCEALLQLPTSDTRQADSLGRQSPAEKCSQLMTYWHEAVALIGRLSTCNPCTPAGAAGTRAHCRPRSGSPQAGWRRRGSRCSSRSGAWSGPRSGTEPWASGTPTCRRRGR